MAKPRFPVENPNDSYAAEMVQRRGGLFVSAHNIYVLKGFVIKTRFAKEIPAHRKDNFTHRFWTCIPVRRISAALDHKMNHLVQSHGNTIRCVKPRLVQLFEELPLPLAGSRGADKSLKFDKKSGVLFFLKARD